MVSSAKLTIAVCLFTFVGASPTLLPRTCNPSFQSKKLTIYQPATFAEVLEWSPVNAEGEHVALQRTSAHTAFANGELFVEQSTNQPDDNYHIRVTTNTNHSLLLTGTTGELFLLPESSDMSQIFAIECSTCLLTDSNPGTSCVIIHPATTTCIMGNADGMALRLAPCDWSLAQVYSFANS